MKSKGGGANQLTSLATLISAMSAKLLFDSLKAGCRTILETSKSCRRLFSFSLKSYSPSRIVRSRAWILIGFEVDWD